jgi:hypothetical protein
MARLLSQPRICTTNEAIRILKPQIFEDARAAGWLRPRAEKASKRGIPTRVYALADVLAVEDRILKGEYPNPK